MEKSKKIIILLIFIALVVVGFFVYKKVRNPSQPAPVSGPTTSSVNSVREKEFYDALKNAAASDQDLDGISDSEEPSYKTDPTNSDTDGDGLNDWQEIFIYTTDPLKNDTDNDTFLDGYEVRRGFSPKGSGTL